MGRGKGALVKENMSHATLYAQVAKKIAPKWPRKMKGEEIPVE